MKLKLLVVFAVINIPTLSAQNSILWSVTKPGSDSVSYVLGTLHQMGNSFIDEKPLIKELLAKSEVAVFESIEDPKEKIVNVMLNRPDDLSYRDHLDPSDVAFIEDRFSKWTIPLSKQTPQELLVKLQQEYIKANCGTVQPADSFDHMDNYLQLLAERNNTKTLGLETYSDQFDAIRATQKEGFDWAEARSAIHFWVENFKTNSDQKRICATSREYMSMKLDYQFDAKCAEDDAFISNRNQKWMPKIIEILGQNKTVFIAVGLLHLYGECGIVSGLRARGYEVKPVKLKRR